MSSTEQQAATSATLPSTPASSRCAKGELAAEAPTAGEDDQGKELERRTWTAHFALQFVQMVYSEDISYRSARSVAMNVATGRLVDSMPPFRRRVVVRRKDLIASARIHCELVVSEKRARRTRGVCGLVVIRSIKSHRGATWLFVAEEEPAELPKDMWGSVASALRSPSRALRDNAKDEILDLFGIPRCGDSNPIG
eukprot:m51a1_g13019 hypothetical protein (196) ;mRNA; f:1794-2945